MKRLWLGTLAVLLLSLAQSRPAAAAMCVDISFDPPAPVVGAETRVVAREEWRSDFGDWQGLPLVADAGGRRVWIGMARSTSDPLEWDGHVVFPASGTWTVSVAYAVAGGRCFSRTVDVRAAGATLPPATPPPSPHVADAPALGVLVLTVVSFGALFVWIAKRTD